MQEVIEKSIGIDNISYFDTLAEIGEGIKNYDYRFFAHKVQCSIDYQLSNAVSEELQGIEYINEYLKRLLFENEFCNNFNRENIIEVLKSYCNDYKELLINIFEPVVTNAIGLDILEKDILKLEITSYESERLLNIFNSMNTDDIKKTVLKSIDNICNILDINSSIKINYMKMTALNLVSRIEEAVRNNNLQNIFLGFKEDKNIVNEVFVDNKTMDNEKLRELIDEISSCRFTEDKIIIIHNEVTSLEDLVEILNNCIWEDEVECLLRNISSDEIYLLKYYLNNKSKDSISNTGWENKFNMLTK